MDHARIVDLVVSLNISITYRIATDHDIIIHMYHRSRFALARQHSTHVPSSAKEARRSRAACLLISSGTPVLVPVNRGFFVTH